ncbi:MAG: hypothetical protein H6Q52_412 [Deltaproteobacteria bacterium]|nr:hypothetical protein [Deltaproteobacteria bacterium]
MLREKKKIETFFRIVRVAKAISTLAVVAAPVAATVGIIAGYGVYSLMKHMRKT